MRCRKEEAIRNIVTLFNWLIELCYHDIASVLPSKVVSWPPRKRSWSSTQLWHLSWQAYMHADNTFERVPVFLSEDGLLLLPRMIFIIWLVCACVYVLRCQPQAPRICNPTLHICKSRWLTWTHFEIWGRDGRRLSISPERRNHLIEHSPFFPSFLRITRVEGVNLAWHPRQLLVSKGK